MSVASYCAEHTISTSTFYLWRRRLGDTRVTTPMKLVEVVTTASSTPPAAVSHGVIEIVLPDSLIVRLGGEVPVTRLREVIAMLREPGSTEARS